jgi:hypothetical protein
VFPEGPKFDGKNVRTALSAKSGVTRDVDLVDGLSNTVLAGSVSPDRKIPWMKPEDVTFDDAFPGPGRPGGFAAPYKTDAGSGGVFVFADGHVGAIREDVDIETWRCLFRIDDRGRVVWVWRDVPEIRPSRGYGEGPMRVIYIDRGDEGATARLELETIPPPERPDMPAPDTGPETDPDDGPVGEDPK